MQLPTIYNTSTYDQVEQEHFWNIGNVDNCGTNTYFGLYGATYVDYNGSWEGAWLWSGDEWYTK